ncbi:E3 SUMO-protein ligase NSE2-like [Agrilus planipennis]|uniref:E3 SUMO-protein ligase NSE2 n=1 Tax=Agrilus planipennis TaxID=224129 RepID=A0A1W4WR01_AGRPL|nr:E3 SUMO-protein ligase NSE2-like [Agrilus planipennis]
MTDKYENLLNSCVNVLRSCKKFIETNIDDEGQQQHLNILNDIAKSYCEEDIEHKRCQAAIDKTIDYFSINSDNDFTRQVEEVYNDFLNQEDVNNDYKQHPIWKRINRPKKSEANVSVDADCSLLVSQVFQPPIDPITKKVIEDPYRNQVCGHIYDYKTILNYMQTTKHAHTRCPYIGCNNNNIQVSFLEKDDQLKDDIEDYLANNNAH